MCLSSLTECATALNGLLLGLALFVERNGDAVVGTRVSANVLALLLRDVLFFFG